MTQRGLRGLEDRDEIIVGRTHDGLLEGLVYFRFGFLL